MSIDDDVLIKLENKDGIMGLSLYPLHLKNHGECSLDDFCLMVKKLINLIGVDHIAISSDLCSQWPDEVVM